MTKHNIQLNTLKECLQFLQWLHNGPGKGMQQQVAKELESRIGNYFSSSFRPVRDIQSQLSPFLGHVSYFYGRLCYDPTPVNYNITDAKTVADALLECVPKFLAAMYYLEYCVNNTFRTLGGGTWEKNWLGYNAGDSWGGDLANYLHAQSSDNYGGTIPGGFRYREVRYNPTVFHRGYPQGAEMASDLAKIVDKRRYYNFFRSVFVTSVIGESANRKENAANSLVLVRTFCDIVLEEDDKDNGGKLIAALNDGFKSHVYSSGNSICWKDLRAHCNRLRKQFDKLLAEKRFDFTGQVTKVSDLNKEELAKKTADWLRTYLTTVRGNLKDIKANTEKHLGTYFTKNLFPYGFTFSGQTRFGITDRVANSLAKGLYTVITELQRSGGDLERLKEILEGTYRKSCPDPLPPKKPEAPPAKVPEEDQDQGKKSEGAQNQGKKAEGAQNQGKKVEGAQNQGKKSEGAQNQGKKSEGAQNQGKKTEGTPNQGEPLGPTTSMSTNQNNGQGEQKFPPPPGVTSTASDTSPGDPGAPGPAGSKGDRDQQGPPGPVAPASSSTQDTSAKQTVQPHQPAPQGPPVPPPPPATPSAPGGPGPAAPQAPTLTNPPSVTGSSAGTTGGQGPGQQGSQDVTQPTSQGTGQNTSSGATLSGAPASSGGGSGGGAGGGGKGQQVGGSQPLPAAPPAQCSSGMSSVLIGGSEICVPKPTALKPTAFVPKMSDDEIWDLQKKEILGEGYRKLQEKIQQRSQVKQRAQIPPTLSTQPRRPTPGPSPRPPGGRPILRSDYYDQVEGRPRQGEPTFIPALYGREMPDDPLPDQTEGDQIYKATLKRNFLKWQAGHQEAQKRKLLEEALEVDGVPLSKFNNSVQTGFDGVTVGGIDGVEVANDHSVDPEEKKMEDAYYKKIHDDITADIDRQIEMKKIEERQKKEIKQHKEMGEKKFLKDLWKVEDFGISGPPSTKTVDHLDIDIYAPPHSHTIPERPDPDITQYINDHPKPQVDIEVADKWSPESNDNSSADFKLADLSFDFQQKDPYYSLGLPPIPPEILIERKDYKTSNEADDLKLEPTEDERSFTDLHIDVPKRTVADPSYDFDIDHDPPPLPGVQPRDPVGPSTAAIALNLTPFEVAPYSAPKDFDTNNINRQTVPMCIPDWSTQKPTHDSTNIPETELFPAEAPRTVREMLTWLAGLRHQKHQETLQKCINNAFKRGDYDASDLRLSVNGADIRPENVIDTIKLAAVFAGSVLSGIAHKWRQSASSATSASKEPDCCALLCQLRDYVYACCHQLAFLRSQCSRVCQQGGWQDCPYGRDAKMSPLQAFLTDAPDSKFETHPFDPCNICLKSRVNMGFTKDDLPTPNETGSHIHTILTPSCGGDDPLLTLTSYLTCITSRTPRTTGELVSFFHNFGNSLYKPHPHLSQLGSALSKPHDHCPDWDHLAADDLNAIQYIRGPAPPTANHDKGHSRTLSTLVGCDITNAQCPPHISSTTYRAYALYSSSFAHAYLSWAVYLADRLWESLLKLHYDLENLQCHDSKSKPLHQCTKALPLLYSHGITPPDGTVQSSLTCSAAVTKLGDVVAGKPIASLMTAMDEFLYRIRAPFLYTITALWLIATLYILHSLLYRMDVLRIRSHLLTTRASHLIDVKALLAGSRRMLSLYKDVDYFDDDLHS
ncbi:Ribosome-binding protein 1 [Babesia ovata]|uniref:Ribosome-binding protein 1 n=1 Tax=Babesia ovata TaxID=189622 RepID=A0A2H6KG68_9APIC|nr:Ribosome-binding protein 1 [Babesia ovata]GBE61981.1 Ribosome-binding protein 1 [Babesia ovata]